MQDFYVSGTILATPLRQYSSCAARTESAGMYWETAKKEYALLDWS